MTSSKRKRDCASVSYQWVAEGGSSTIYRAAEIRRGEQRFVLLKAFHKADQAADADKISVCKDSLFMIGDGGMGKTTSLLQIMDDTYRSEGVREGPLVIFLELYSLPQNSG